MGKGQRLPRSGCFMVDSRGAYEITDLGMAQVRELAAIGARPAQIAQYLRVSDAWLSHALDPEHDSFKQDVADAYDEGASEFQRRLLQAQQNLADTNAQMAIHLGKHHLGQKEDAQEVNHNIKIVGTLPDYGSTSDDWKRQFAPSALQSVEPPKAKPVIIDAEIVKE